MFPPSRAPIPPNANATNINGLEIKQDENGVLKIGDVIIPQRYDRIEEILGAYLDLP